MTERIETFAAKAGRPGGEGFFVAMSPDDARRQLHVSLGLAAALFAGALFAASLGVFDSARTGAGAQAAAKLTIELPGHIKRQHAGLPAGKSGG